MKQPNHALNWIAVLLCASLLSLRVFAALPETLGYQAYLTSDTGIPLNGVVQVTFTLYDAQQNGNALWTDAQDVTVSNGLFSVQLGGPGSPFPDELFGQALWLGIQVGADPEMTPRRGISGSAYAFRAPVCVEGDFIHCYTGPAGTMGVGLCTDGTRTCSADSGFGACEGEVVPVAEICDGQDNDCNGLVDDNAPGGTPWYPDLDADGFGDPGSTVTACAAPPGYVADNTDCDDGDASINPAAPEICDDLDNDCDGQYDEQAIDAVSWFLDADADGYGDTGSTTVACEVPSGHVADDTDCDDGDSTVHPAANEICDGLDNNCDGQTDETCLALGQACISGSQCLSQSCVDGVCCASACSSTCESCSIGTPGTCSPIPFGQDPDNECTGSSCNGLGACQ